MENNQIIKTHWANTLTFKMALIAIMSLILLIPLGMIESMISEREATAQQVENDISAQWGDAQTLVGPILSVPTLKTLTDKDGAIYHEKGWLYIMPNEMDADVALKPDIRYRGIYKTAVYTSTNHIRGNFLLTIKPEEVDGVIEWDKAYVTMGITDNRGIRGDVNVLWNGQKMATQSGMVTKEIARTGFSVKTPLSADLLGSTIPFDITMELSGSKSFSMVPIGQNSRIKIASPWKDPSFSGSLLPQDRKITEQGFEANWSLTHLNRNFPQYWQNQQFDVGEHQLGVNLFLPVNHYQKSHRSAKYGILFIALTMLVFLFMELTKNKKVHLFQYLLVGLALVLFFSVLTSLSEHIGFNWAYLVAAAANVAMIGLFAKGLLGDKQLTVWVVGLLTIMYLFLFVLLQLNDYAFLAGNIGLLIALGFIMKASLKLGGKAEEEAISR
jgi:inner membrane protein